MAHDGKITILEAILSYNPNAKVTVSSNDNIPANSDITWEEGTTPISNDDIAIRITQMQTNYDGKVYARNRRAQYPHYMDFLEAYTEKEIDGDSTKWDAYVTARNKVKTDNPK
jgi:hypothetical protein